jgi:SAM-dependent methyltransferase
VLDLGAGPGSFRTVRNDLSIVRLDLEIPRTPGSGSYVAADAARMPFASRSFDLVISNHSLEHFPALEETVREIGRVIRPDGVLYIAVPDAGTLSDRIYRWMGRGGGHVNAFRSPGEVTAMVERLAGLPVRSSRVLYSSLSFLNAHNLPGRPQRKSLLFAFGNERYLAVLMWVLRRLDLRFHTRLSHYGWSFYFGNTDLPAKLAPWINVCVRCGSAHAAVFLRKVGAVPPIPGVFQSYQCPSCGGYNLLTDDSGEVSGNPSKLLYDLDFVEWADQVAGLLRAGRTGEVDLESVAEEMESLGNEERSAARIELHRMLITLIGRRIQPDAQDPGWRSSIAGGRREMEARIQDSPSLLRHLEENLPKIYGEAVRDVLVNSARGGKEEELGIPAQCPWSLKELLRGAVDELDRR